MSAVTARAGTGKVAGLNLDLPGATFKLSVFASARKRWAYTAKVEGAGRQKTTLAGIELPASPLVAARATDGPTVPLGSLTNL